MPFIDIHTHQYVSSPEVVAIMNVNPNEIDVENFFSVGIHPWHIKNHKLELDFQILQKHLSNGNCLAIGECGLDKLSETNVELQQEVFLRQIALSEKYQKPLIIHCVKAYQEVLELRKKLQPTQQWIIHGFRKSNQLAMDLIKHKIHLSFGSALLYDQKLQSVFQRLPLDFTFLETDDADISIEQVYEKAAALKQMKMKYLKEKITHKFNTIFIK